MEGGETVLDVLHERRIYVQFKKSILPIKIGSSPFVVVVVAEIENLSTNKRSQKA